MSWEPKTTGLSIISKFWIVRMSEIINAPEMEEKSSFLVAKEGLDL